MTLSDQTSSPDSRWLEFTHVYAGYDGPPVLEDITFSIPRGARVAVVGPNGAGKSTLFRLLARLIPVRAGEIRIHGQPVGQHDDCVAYVPQRSEVDWHFPVTVKDVVGMGRYGVRGWFRPLGRKDLEVVMRMIDLMGLSALADVSIADLSGGQQQRVFLARALAQEPHILILDEPLNGVDVTTQETIFRILDQLRETVVTVLFATHDLNLAATQFDLVALVSRTLIAYGSPASVLCQDNIQRAFGGRALILGGMVVADHCCPD